MADKKTIPIGVEDFKKLVDRNYYFVDKTLLIKREFDEKRIEKTAKICYNENNHKLRKQKGGFFYGTNSNFL